MSEEKINYKDVSVIRTFNEYLTYEFKRSETITKQESFLLKGEYLEYTNENEEKYYQIVIKLPFRLKSNWKKQKQKIDCQEILEEPCKLLETKLNSKYKDIQLRDYKAKELLKIFEKEVKEGNKNLYATKFNHGNLYDKISDKTIFDISKKISNKITELKRINTLSKDSQNDDFKLKWECFVSMMILNSCYYCGVSISHINEIAEKDELFTKRKRGYSLEVDQKNAYEGYTNDNCVASCYWCNNAKTDEFTEQEFKIIAIGINKIWNDRLKKIKSESNILFPQYT